MPVFAEDRDNGFLHSPGVESSPPVILHQCRTAHDFDATISKKLGVTLLAEVVAHGVEDIAVEIEPPVLGGPAYRLEKGYKTERVTLLYRQKACPGRLVRSDGESVKDQLGARPERSGCFKGTDPDNSFYSETAKTLVGRLRRDEGRANLVDIQLVLSGGIAGVEAAEVLIGDHVQPGPTARDSEEKTGGVRISAHLMERNGWHPRIHPIADHRFEAKTLSIDVQARQTDDGLYLASRPSLRVTALPDAENQVAAGGVGEGGHVAQKFALVLVAIPREGFLVLKLTALTDRACSEALQPIPVDLVKGEVEGHGARIES